MTINFETLRFDVIDNIAIITVNRPDKLNALNEQVLKELKECISDLDPAIRGLILTGEGDKAFIAGADIKAMSMMSAQEAETFSGFAQDITVMFEELPIPVIAAVNGYALGGGCEFAMCADFIYATENAVFALPEVTLGLIPGFGGSQRLAKFVGRHVAKELIYTGRFMKVDEAKKRGLVLESFESKEALIEAASKTLQMAANNSGIAIAKSKKSINEGVDLTLEEGLLIEKIEFGKIFDTEDKTEGLAAFLEKRTANFPGR